MTTACTTGLKHRVISGSLSFYIYISFFLCPSFPLSFNLSYFLFFCSLVLSIFVCCLSVSLFFCAYAFQLSDLHFRVIYYLWTCPKRGRTGGGRPFYKNNDKKYIGVVCGKLRENPSFSLVR